MKLFKRILLVLAVLIVIIQFVRPPRNIAEVNSKNDISTRFGMSQDVREMLRTSCFDCHSDNTMYPWYAEVQPVGWWLNSHIQGARRELNFSEFSSYRPRRQFIKLGQIVDQLNTDEMPLPSYLLIHTYAKLSQDQKEKLVAWANATRDSMKAVYPVDSLERRQKGN